MLRGCCGADIPKTKSGLGLRAVGGQGETQRRRSRNGRQGLYTIEDEPGDSIGIGTSHWHILQYLKAIAVGT